MKSLLAARRVRRGSPLDRLSQELPELRRIAREAESAERFPASGVDILRRLGLLATPLARLRGGDGWGSEGNTALFEALCMLGSASLVLGRIYEAHVNAMRLIDRYASPIIAAQTARDVLDGHLFAVWVTPSADPVRVRRTGDGYQIFGTKGFCSGAGQATRAVITAADERGEERLVWTDATQATVGSAGEIRMQGMRSAHTRPVQFDMRVDADPVIGQAGDYVREPEFSVGAWRTSAVTVGGLGALVGETIEQLRSRGRHADPHQSARIGRMLIACHGAHMWGQRAARDAEWTGGPPSALAAIVNLARVAIETACLETIPLVQRSLGLGGLLTSNPVESMLRDLAVYLRQPAGDEALTEAALWFAENGSRFGGAESAEADASI